MSGRSVQHGIRNYLEAETVGDYAETTSLVAPMDGATTPTLSGQQGTAAANFLKDFPDSSQFKTTQNLIVPELSR